MNDQIRKLINELDAHGKIREDAWQITLEEGELLHQIALSAHARVIVEIGTSYGFSALFFGAALLHTGGLLHTIDINPSKAESAKKNIRRRRPRPDHHQPRRRRRRSAGHSQGPDRHRLHRRRQTLHAHLLRSNLAQAARRRIHTHRQRHHPQRATGRFRQLRPLPPRRRQLRSRHRQRRRMDHQNREKEKNRKEMCPLRNTKEHEEENSRIYFFPSCPFVSLRGQSSS